MKIDIIAGARPNFIKIAPLIETINKFKKNGKDINYRLVHTGQHYDKNMSGSFFEQLGIPDPDVNLGAGGGTQAEQTAAIMMGYEKLLLLEPVDLCVVVGDVTSTMACTIVARKLTIPVAHIEAGIRSGDWTMPEEINRVVTDSITNYFFTTTVTAVENLIKQGVDESHIFFVGNIMIDTFFKNRNHFKPPLIWNQLQLKKEDYLLLTMHRPSNVDDKEKLIAFLTQIINNSKVPVVFPVHPRTSKILQEMCFESDSLHLIEPLSYLEFNYLAENAKAVITDSGGITEETTVMGVPCITLRNSTERPETITIGTNELIGSNPQAIPPILKKLFENQWKKGKIPEKWDGKTAERIVEILWNLRDDLN
ncbi:UDP-N-acetylglucosamine 2-epimerase (non-hydrolyzing) [Flavobacterium sp. NG2]|uniref:non-hydrolyzing UDP-N-acetylglucosamine 2-epimerase n=1 Tax=Flavobacterium sp. NG2 TaxID=3097547 RepID=UPI002A82A83E|nr:UDP-N-acetylglucosamine 2-epimerase (non-hydrolyzing) [Flavobacterium sp. NG2]WPR71607.1 UDP-N-acetylglucosamine 2-epimerase (non-hydrolyzing) [Flavobacterium sp. NG2]